MPMHVALSVAMLKKNSELCHLLINDWDDSSECDRDAALKKHGPVFGCAMRLVGIFATSTRKTLLEQEFAAIASLSTEEQLAIKKLTAVAAGSDCLGGKLMKVMDSAVPKSDEGARHWLDVSILAQSRGSPVVLLLPTSRRAILREVQECFRVIRCMTRHYYRLLRLGEAASPSESI